MNRLLHRPWLPYALLAALAVAYVVATVLRHPPQLSVFDEGTYLDVLFTLPENLVAQTGEAYGLEIREYWSCVGNMYYGATGMPCGSDYLDLSLYPQQGLTSADAYTPLFFWIMWPVAEAVQLLGVDFVTAARLAMALWLVPTSLFLFAALRWLRVPAPFGLAVVALFIVSPFSWWTFTYVSTDAPVALVGAVSLWLTLRFLRGRGSLWWLVPVAIIGQAFKVTSFLAPLLVGLICLVYWIGHRLWRSRTTAPALARGVRIRWRAWFWPVLASGAGLAAVQLGWGVIRARIALGDPPVQYLQLPYGEGGELLFQVTNFLFHTVIASGPWQIGTGQVYGVDDLMMMTYMLLIIGGVIGALLRRSDSVLDQSLTLAVPVAALSFGPLLFGFLIVLDATFTMPGRYGAALLPAFFALLALVTTRRFSQWLLGAVAVAAVLYVLAFAPSFA